MIAGANQLRMALQLIARVEFQIRPWLGETIDDRGIVVQGFGDVVTINGHVQSVNKNVYQQLGLDFQKQYIRVYTDSTPIGELARDRSSDLILFNGKQYRANSETDWMVLDGWQRVLCVMV